MKILTTLTGIAFMGTLASAANAQVLLRDDFNGTALDSSKWSVGNWKLGRTQLGLAPVVAGGIARLKFETFDPRAAGGSFAGTEIDSNLTFSLGSGVEFETRVRMNTPVAGLVSSFFTYQQQTVNGEIFNDEIDFEWLSKHTLKPPSAGTPVQLTTYRAFNNTKPIYEDATQISSEKALVAGLNLKRFNTFLIRWLPDRVEWLVNGRLVRTAQTAVPQGEMKICLNFWAPESSWAEAFSPALVPAQTARQNRVLFYEVDYVEVRRISPAFTSSQTPSNAAK